MIDSTHSMFDSCDISELGKSIEGRIAWRGVTQIRGAWAAMIISYHDNLFLILPTIIHNLLHLVVDPHSFDDRALQLSVATTNRDDMQRS